MPSQFMYRIFLQRPVKRVLENVPYVRRLYSGWNKVHPFDVAYGTDTSGYLSVEEITADPALRRQINPYAGSQPTAVRRALAAIPHPEQLAFVDIGCGKGRVVLVAAEFPFAEVTGVELSAELVRIAEANAARVRANFPSRSPIRIVEGNAVAYPFAERIAERRLVVYLCHSLGRDLLTAMLRSIERSIASSAIEQLFFVYYNPVYGDLLDNSPVFRRWFADVLPYDDTEIGYGPDLEDTIVIWQAGQQRTATVHAGATRPIVIHKVAWSAGLGPVDSQARG